MKCLKVLSIIFFTYLSILNFNLKSQNGIGNAELYIKNFSQNDIIVSLYPASAIFSGYTTTTPQFNYKYSFSRARRDGNPPQWPLFQDSIYINGGVDGLLTNEYILFDFDDGAYYSASNNVFGISFGLWRMDLYSPLTSDTQSYYLDYRDYNIGNYLYPFAMDIYIYLDGIAPDSVNVFFSGAQQIVPISDTRFHSRTIKIWDQVGRIDTATGQQLPPLIPNKGTFTSSNELSTYLTYPMDATKFGATDFENSGDLGMNLIINHNISTRDTLLQSPTNILIPVKGYLKINPGNTFNIIPAVNGFNNLIVQDSSELILKANSHLIVDGYNALTLKERER
ncbi:MAG: hypothetical protein IPL53_20615 [Ignavibacteria bacterium]|nr:hypothetical protein [Ignavibacteria bacterium]